MKFHRYFIVVSFGISPPGLLPGGASRDKNFSVSNHVGLRLFLHLVGEMVDVGDIVAKVLVEPLVVGAVKTALEGFTVAGGVVGVDGDVSAGNAGHIAHIVHLEGEDGIFAGMEVGGRLVALEVLTEFACAGGLD